MSGPVLRGNIWYFRKRLPPDLIEILGCWVVVKSLKTNKRYSAMIRYGQILQSFEFLISFIRMNNKLDTQKLKTFFHTLLQRQLGMLEPEDGSFAAPKSYIKETSVADIEELMRDEDDECYNLGLSVINQYPELKAFEDQLDQDQIRHIGSLRLRGMKEQRLQMDYLRTQGQFRVAFDSFFDEVFSSSKNAPEAPTGATQVNPKTKLAASITAAKPQLGQDVKSNGNLDVIHSLAAVYSAFAGEMGDDWGKRVYKFNEARDLMCDMFGDHTDIRTISATHVRQVKDSLQKYPVRASNKPQYKGLNTIERIAKAERDDDDRLGAKTVNDKLGNISIWFKWAKDNLYVDKNLFEGISVKVPKGEDPRDPFSANHLRLIFSSYVYTGMSSEKHWYEFGTIIVKNARYWVPLIAVHTGMRIEEICQLKLENICQIDDIWCFDLKDKKLKIKTKSASRRVPVHNNLWDVWEFGKWIQAQKSKRPETSLVFEELKPNYYGQYSSAFSKWFNNYLTHLNIKTKQLVFHSFRHTVKDLLLNTGMEYQMMQTLIGHKLDDVSSVYGHGYGVKLLNEGMQKMPIPFEKPKT